MTRRSIVLILVITAIITSIAFISLSKEKAIDYVVLSKNSDVYLDKTDISSNESYVFESNSEIYAIIMLKNIKTNDRINVKWKKIEENKEILIQEDNIIEKNEGSGPLVISLLRKNNKHNPGNYILYTSLNENPAIEKQFTINN